MEWTNWWQQVIDALWVDKQALEVDQPVAYMNYTARRVGAGDVRATLTWSGIADLDLHVIDPSGFELYFNSARAPDRSPSGGTLDVDQNAGCPPGSPSGSRVENIFWPTNRAPSGQYKAFVVNYDTCGGASLAYRLQVYVDNRIVRDTSGVLQPGQGSSSPVLSFQR